MNPTKQLFVEKIAAGLQRKSVQSPSRWAEAYRMMGKPIPGKWTLKYHPWLKDMLDTKATKNVGKKAAQLGFSEMALNTVFYRIDVEGENCLYILPAKNPDATDFSASRFDPALEDSPYLKNLFSDVKNVGHKRAGSANLYIRGSNSRAGLKSVPSGVLIFDELDEMNQANISLAEERASGQFNKLDWRISTPTAPGYGISREYNLSTQEHFYFPCPCCSVWTELVFPDCIVITAKDSNDPRLDDTYLQCKECKNKLEHKAKPDFLGKGKWQAAFHGRSTRGFYINQLYSSTVSPAELAKAYLTSLIDKASEQEFYNSKLGMEHLVDGARIEDIHIENCITDYRKSQTGTSKLITMGIDVGKWCHVEVDEWEVRRGTPAGDINVGARPKVLWQGKVAEYSELDAKMRAYGVVFAVIDAQPDRRSSFDFANRFYGRVKLCFYGKSVSGKMISRKEDNDDLTITVDRTSWMDTALGRFHRGKAGILLPVDIDIEYREQIKAPVRRYEKDKQGNPVGKYVEVGPDHYAHARTYAEIALPLAVSFAQSQRMGSVL